MNRRNFLQTIGLGTLSVALPKSAIAQYLSPATIDPSSGLETFVELAENYHPKAKTVTVLYPGSGWDLTPLEFGLQLLYHSDAKNINFIYTEIGEYEKDLPTWHEGISDLHKKLYNGLEKLVDVGIAEKVSVDLTPPNPWKQRAITNSKVINYDLIIPVKNKQKTIRITLAYNCFEDRKEPTTEEKNEFNPKIIANARTNYWPEGQQGISPTYFHQDHLDEADVIISKQCGDFGLLQFDIVRAIRKTPRHKQRVILTEHSNQIGPFAESLDKYQISIAPLRNNKYGYCLRSGCPVGAVIVIPNK